MTTNPKRPRQSFKKYPMNRAKATQIIPREESFRWNAIQEIHWGKRENSKEGVIRENI